MKISWPPKPLGLGPLFNLVTLSRETRPLLIRSWWLIPVLGLATALAMIGADQLFFGGATMSRTPSLSSHPPIGNRVLVALIGSLGEELVFRVVIATITAWVIYFLLRFVVAEPKRPAQWISVFAAAIGVGLMHVGQVGNPADFWRIMTVNVIGHSVYGFLYWTRGFEVAVLTHVIVTSLLYIGVPALR